eukprot:403352456
MIKSTTTTLTICLVFMTALIACQAQANLQATATKVTNQMTSKFDGNCMKCVTQGYWYCMEFEACQPVNQTCARGVTYNSTTGCPVHQGCPFGANGIVYLGNKNVTGGYGADGSVAFNVTARYPCYLAIVNDKVEEITYNLVGNNMNVQMMNLQFPTSNFKHTSMNLGKEYKMLKSDNITYLYIGSINDNQQLARLTWNTKTNTVITKNSGFLTNKYTSIMFAIIVLAFHQLL